MRSPANGTSESNSNRSDFRPFWTPALRRLSMMLFSKADPSSSVAVFSDSERTGVTVACGDRLSTVKGPETRTLRRSSSAWS